MAELNLHSHVTRQYQASLAMLGQAIELCPETLWQAPEYPNPFWHIAYHALFYTHLYLQAGEKAFRPWGKHQPDSQYLGARPWGPPEKVRIERPYTKAEVLEYWTLCCQEVEARVPSLDFAGESGFSWLPFNKFEVQLYNLRHIQHHAGQLADRLRTGAGIGVKWVRPE